MIDEIKDRDFEDEGIVEARENNTHGQPDWNKFKGLIVVDCEAMRNTTCLESKIFEYLGKIVSIAKEAKQIKLVMLSMKMKKTTRKQAR